MLVAALAGAGGGAAATILAVMLLGAAPVEEQIGLAEPLAELSAAQPAPLMAGDRAVAADAVGGEIVVDVAGAVSRPGLHRLRAGDRVGDAIEAAGGFAARADLGEAGRSLNLAALLDDGSKVLVPELGRRVAESGSSDSGLIDLNGADRAALESLPGIGPVTAGRIMTARSEQAFGSVRELRARGLVGQAVFEDVKGLVQVTR